MQCSVLFFSSVFTTNAGQSMKHIQIFKNIKIIFTRNICIFLLKFLHSFSLNTFFLQFSDFFNTTTITASVDDQEFKDLNQL